MKGLSPKGTVPLRKSQGGYLLITVVVALFLLATVAVMLTHGSAINANTASAELEAARADYVAEAAMQHAMWRAQNNACMGDVTIPDTALGADSYSATITGAASGTLYNLSADQDAWIRSDQPTNNGGGDLGLHIKDSQVEQSLYRFDLSSLPAGAQINFAVASFYVSAEHPEGPVTVHRITTGWNEGDATWDSISGSIDSGVLATIPAQLARDVRVQVNITGQVQAWVNGQPNNGILLASSAPGIHAQYASREDGANQPRLEVVVGSGPASPVTIQADGTLANGNTRSLTRVDNRALQPSSVHVFQPDAIEGVDAYIWEAQKTTNKGTDDETWVSRTSNNASLSLLKFNMGAIPARSKILSATLSLHNRSGNNSNVPVTAHRITNPWNEDFVTWNNRDSGTTWDAAGGDVDPTVIATTNVGPTRFIRYEWDITSLVQGWTNGAYENFGVALATAMASSVGERFDTSDHSDPTRRPKLTIEFACECGSACMAPQGAGTIAMVVINPTTLVPADAYKKALFESWGYTVNVIGENTNAAGYMTAAASNDVFFISETIGVSQVGTRIKDVPIGVVSQDGAYNSQLGIATGSAWPVGSSINVTDNSHYITAVFPTGPLDIYVAGMEQLTISGSAASGLQTLADTGGAGSLVVLDKGAALGGDSSSENAAGRRVMLPLGRDNSLNWDYLNSNGRLIVQRALQWGTSNVSPVSGYNVLLIVGNDTTLASKDVGYKALMESWGHTVAVLDDGASQADYDTAMAAADVIYASGSALGSNMLDKATYTTKGLVNEVNGKIDNFGFSSSTSATANLDTFSATLAAHYITEPFAGSAVTVFASSLTNPIPGGTLAPDLQNVGEISGTPSLVTLDAGATGWNGTPVPARRAHLPFAAAETTDMTADGKTILQRSLEWAVGAGVTGNTYAVLMIVADPSSPAQAAADRKALMESWGYTVTLIDDDDSTVNLITAIDVADVVYVGAGTINTDGVIKILTNIPKGVVNEPSLLVSNIGFSSGVNVAFAVDALTIMDGTHSITQGLASPTTVYTALAVPTVLSGTLSPELQNLGEFLGAPALAVLESGAARHNTGVTPGRRAQLPFEAAVGSDLTADGQLIVRRAIEWAAGDALGPIAHWMLDDGTGQTAVDSEGGHDGTLSVGGPVWVAGTIGDALNFDGADDYVDLTSDAELDDVFVGGATVMAWIEPASWGDNGYGRIFDKSSVAASTGDGWAIRLNKDNGGLNFGQGFTGGRGWWRFAESSINFDTWHHIALAYDASSTTNDPIVYLDGSPVAVTRVDTPSGDVRSDAAINLRLGSHASVTFNVFEGKIDDARIYDRILDASEIADLAAQGGGGGDPDGGGGGIVFEEFTEGRQQIGVSSGFSIPKPSGTSAGDLLIVAAATDGNTVSTLSPNPTWNLTQLDVFDSSGAVTFGVWWKIADGTEGSQLNYSWTGGEQAYGWIMRFTGHDPSSPIATASMNSGRDQNPQSNNLITGSDGNLILRLGGFDDDDITVDAPGLSGHTVITMDRSNTGSLNTVSGGAGYVIQTTAGDTGTSQFNLTAREQYRTITIAIRPAP